MTKADVSYFALYAPHPGISRCKKCECIRFSLKTRETDKNRDRQATPSPQRPSWCNQLAKSCDLAWFGRSRPHPSESVVNSNEPP